MEIKYELSEDTDEAYDSDFVDKVEESRNQYEKGEFISVEKKDINKLLGLE
ncbi:MAG: hypothetical protein M9887_00930 [Chitinophagales bacterium]|nr:hypothetical protein [Chitinophagales bacterium]